MTRRRAVGVSALVHAVLLGTVSFVWLFRVEAVAEPPLPIRFVSAPPRPLLEPFRFQETADDSAEPAPPLAPPKPAPARIAAAPPAPPVTEPVAAAVEPASAPPIRTSALDDLPPSIAGGRPARSSVTLTLGTVAAAPGIVVTGGNAALAPDPGTGGRRRSAASVSPPIAAAPGVAALSPGPPAAGRAGARPDAADREDVKPAADAEAARLGKRFSLQLVDARRLGRSTHDGWRYNQVLASLTEAYLGLARRGGAAVVGVRDGDIDSIEVDPDAIAIAYRDGTRHVIAPTPDGLVVLYVAADPAARSKVDEAERALAALRRLARDGSRS